MNCHHLNMTKENCPFLSNYSSYTKFIFVLVFFCDLLTVVLLFLGQIMQTLDRLKLKGNTLVYVTSDQGPHLEEISIHGEVHRGFSGIYRGITCITSKVYSTVALM